MNNNSVMPPLVSVIVTTYNQEQTIGRTLDCILAQKVDFVYEVILGEDASPSDKTRAVCETYAVKYPNIIKLQPAAPNKGVLKNYQDCIGECRGKYIAVCAGDDWWHNPLKMKLQVDFLESNSDYGLVHTNHQIYNAQSGVLTPESHREPPQGLVYNELFKYCFITAPTVMFQRRLMQYVDFDGFHKAGINIEDYPTWLEFAHRSKIGYIDLSTVTYSVIENSLSHASILEKRLLFIEQIHRIHAFYIKRYPQESPSQVESDVYYKRSIYMELLKYKEYTRAKAMVAQLGFPKFISIALRAPLGGYFTRMILCSNLYRRVKKL